MPALDPASEALIAALQESPGMAALRAAMSSAEDEWLASIAKTIAKGKAPLDQRKIDETRGYFRGANFALHGRVHAAVAETEKEER